MMCWLGHAWPKWRMERVDLYTIDGRIVEVTRNVRSCKRCGLTRLRDLRR
jgi:hypothetical protein